MGSDPSQRPAVPGAHGEAVFARYVEDKLDLLRQRQQEGTVRHPAGFLVHAMRHNDVNTPLEQETARREQQRQAEQRRKLEQDHIQLQRYQDEAVQALCQELLATHPSLVTEALTALRKQKDQRILACYDPQHSALDNSRDHPLVANAMCCWRTSRFPERFAPAYHPYRDTLVAMEATLAALQKGSAPSSVHTPGTTIPAFAGRLGSPLPHGFWPLRRRAVSTRRTYGRATTHHRRSRSPVANDQRPFIPALA